MSAVGSTTEATGEQATPIDGAAVARDFPALAQRVRGHRLVYLDNAATTQKPQAVLDAVVHAYTHLSGNVHRGVHHISAQATAAYEGTRAKVARFIGAANPSEIVFVRGATEGINLVASSWAAARLTAGDEVLVTELEHHANWVPWQLACARRGAHFRVVPVDDAGDVDLEAFAAMVGPRTRVVALSHVSNALGTINPVAQMVQMVRQACDAVVLVDGAQAAPHLPIDVGALGCDFYVFSGHKVFGPTGIGALWGRRALLEDMPPYQSGGDMIATVSAEATTFNEVPHKFEAGTPHIAGTIALGAALDYVTALGPARIAAHERRLVTQARAALDGVEGLRRLGNPKRQAAVVAFTLDGVHPHDIATILDQEGIAIRAGHHCAQPLLARYQLPASARCSLAPYNTAEDVAQLAAGLRRVRRLVVRHG